MGWLDGILGSAITGAFGMAQQYNQNKFNAEQAELNRDFQSDEAEKNRLFQGNEAALQRDWSSQEAERARDWEEEMYAKYNSLSGKITQAEQAGVNPMLAVTGNAVSPMSASSSAPSGASAGSVGTPSGSAATAAFVDIIGQIMGVKKTQAEIDLMKKQGEKTDSETAQILKDTEWMDKLNNMSLQESTQRIAQSVSEIANSNADTKVKSAEYDLVLSKIRNSNADTKVKENQIGVFVAEIAVKNKSLDVMEQQIKSMISSSKLDSKKVDEIDSILNTMKQEYDHNAIMNAFEESIGALKANDADFWNPDNYGGNSLKSLVVRLLRETKSLLSFGNI